MCFSNLPVEVDDDGNVYLADEADDVERPVEGRTDPTPGGDGVEADLAADPEGAYRAIVDSLPPDTRAVVEAGDAPDLTDEETAEGD